MGASKFPVIVKFTRGKLAMNTKLRTHLSCYLDELAKHYSNAKYPGASTPQAPLKRGQDYYSEAEQGRISVHGYLREFIVEEEHKIPEEIPRNQLAQSVSWAMHRAAVRLANKRRESEIGHKLVFSSDTEVTNRWKESGIDIDQALRTLVQQTLERYSRAAMGG